MKAFQHMSSRRETRFSRAQAAVECALVTPIVAFLLVIAGDLMRMYYVSIAVSNAAKAGVQYGVQNAATAADLSGMEQAAKNDASNVPGMTATASMYCQCPGSSTTFSCASGDNCSDERVYVEVDTSATFKTIVSYPGLPSSITLAGKAFMREQ